MTNIKKAYLLTGATGFIGSCLLRRLVAEGARPHIIIREGARLWRIKDLLPWVKCHVVDMMDARKLQATVRNVRPNIVYHLAVYGAYSSQKDPDRMVMTNIMGGWNLLKAAAAAGSELFVNTGTSSEYGTSPKSMKESDVLEPLSYYAVTKCAMTWVCAQASRQKDITTVTLRPFSAYGPYEEPSRLVPTLMKTFFQGGSMDLVGPKIAHDFIFIDDIIEAYLNIEALKKHPGDVFNIGTGKQTTIKEIVEITQKVAGKSADLRWGAMPSRSWDSAHWLGDVKAAKTRLGWRAKTSLEEGLRKTWQWYCQNHRLYLTSGPLPA